MTRQLIYRAVGTTRQAHAAFWQRRARLAELLDGAEAQLKVLRRDHPGLGLQKAWHMIRPVGVSRFRFCYEMTWRGYALATERRYVRLTRSGPRRFPNLVTGLVITAPHQVWASDTTYYRIGDRFYYLTFIIDLYSRLIVGAHASKDLRAQANVAALRQAFAQSGTPAELSGLILHSDGGVQYLSQAFVSELRRRGVSSSRCSVALDNAYAERLNGIIKGEYLEHWQPQTFAALGSQLRRAVRNYNERRSHSQLPLGLSPQQFVHRWQQDDALVRYALLIKDGQSSGVQLCPQATELFTAAGKYARAGGEQILPCDVTYVCQREWQSVVKVKTNQS